MNSEQAAADRESIGHQQWTMRVFPDSHYIFNRYLDLLFIVTKNIISMNIVVVEFTNVHFLAVKEGSHMEINKHIFLRDLLEIPGRARHGGDGAWRHNGGENSTCYLAGH